MNLNSVGDVTVRYGETLGCKSTHVTFEDVERATLPLLRDEMIDMVMEIASKSGVKVGRDAVEHNFNAWRSDYKSGYRDEENGIFVFTPCGCNPLSFDFAELKDGCKWQQTYEC